MSLTYTTVMRTVSRNILIHAYFSLCFSVFTLVLRYLTSQCWRIDNLLNKYNIYICQKASLEHRNWKLVVIHLCY